MWSYNCAEEDANAFIEAIGFSKDSNLPLLAAGTLNGKLYILDFVKQVSTFYFNDLLEDFLRIFWLIANQVLDDLFIKQ